MSPQAPAVTPLDTSKVLKLSLIRNRWPGPGDRRELVDAMERLDVKPGEVFLRRTPGSVGGGGSSGEAVQVEPMKSKLKAPGTL